MSLYLSEKSFEVVNIDTIVYSANVKPPLSKDDFATAPKARFGSLGSPFCSLQSPYNCVYRDLQTTHVSNGKKTLFLNRLLAVDD